MYSGMYSGDLSECTLHLVQTCAPVLTLKSVLMPYTSSSNLLQENATAKGWNPASCSNPTIGHGRFY